MFQIRSEQYAAMRRKRIGDDLIASLSGMPFSTHWDESKSVVQIDDALRNRSTVGFDGWGFVDRVVSPLGRTWQYTNSSDGKLLQLIGPSGSVCQFGYANDGKTTYIAATGQQQAQIHYSVQSRLSGVSFADGTFGAIEYTPWGAACKLTDRLSTATAFDYDKFKRLTAITDGNGNSTRFAYGGFNRPDSVAFPNGTSERYTYDTNGRITSIVRGDVHIQTKVNKKGQPLHLAYSDGTEIALEYDDKGRIIKAAMGDLVTELKWNDRGQVEEEIINGLSNKFAFDTCERVAEVTLTTGDRIAYRYDADSRLTAVVDWNGGEHLYEYSAGDSGYALHAPNGTHTVTRLNQAGARIGIDVISNWKSLFSLAYAFDGDSRVAAVRDSVFGERSFTYDLDGQVLSADGGGPRGSERFAYDRNHNPTQLHGGLVGVDGANQLLLASGEHLSYDSRGNLVVRSGSSGTWRYAYDARNLMTSSTSPSGETTVYTYDAFGRRTSKRTGDRETRFFWLCEQMIGERTVDLRTGTTRRQDYLYIPGSYTVLATRIDGVVYSCHSDHGGNSRALTGPDGALAWLADYSTFGIAKIALSQAHNPMRFQGQYFDEETGFHYNRFRYYSPVWGRYVTRDPIGFLAGTNFYAYVGNDPINSFDPLGLVDWGGVLTGVVAGVTSAAVGVIVGAVLFPALGPFALPIGGAVAGALNSALTNFMNLKPFCWKCALAAAGVGALAGIPAAWGLWAGVGATAGVAALYGAIGGAASGVTSYVGSCETSNPPTTPTVTGVLVAAGIGAVSGGAGAKYQPTDVGAGVSGVGSGGSSGAYQDQPVDNSNPNQFQGGSAPGSPDAEDPGNSAYPSPAY